MKRKKIQFYLENPSRHLYSFVEGTTKTRLILIIYALVTALYRARDVYFILQSVSISRAPNSLFQFAIFASAFHCHII